MRKNYIIPQIEVVPLCASKFLCASDDAPVVSGANKLNPLPASEQW